MPVGRTFFPKAGSWQHEHTLSSFTTHFPRQAGKHHVLGSLAQVSRDIFEGVWKQRVSSEMTQSEDDVRFIQVAEMKLNTTEADCKEWKVIS